MTALLELDGLAVVYGGVTAVEEVNLAVAEGALVGLIGPNGAGKTSVMRAITGSVTPRSGRILFRGDEISALPTHRRVRAGLALSQQIVRPFRSMSLIENVMLAAGYRRTARPLRALFSGNRAAERARAREILELVGIGEAAEAAPSSLPLGFLKRLEVARALALDPKLLLLDEPLAGLNSNEAARLADTIVALNDKGLTVLLIEHNLSEVLRVCRRLVVLDNGRKIAEGTPRAVMADRGVRAAYLGEESDHAAA